MPLISIITTTYKHQDFIAYTIESVLSQTFSDWELLIGDDSPDDATWCIIQSYVAKYPNKIKARHHNPNKGIVDNMNFLIGQTSQESQYIAFLEGDDMYMPTNLEEKIKVFEKCDDVWLVYSNFSKINETWNIIQQHVYHNTEPFSWWPQDKYRFVRDPSNVMSYSSGLIKKSILNTCFIRTMPWLQYCVASDRDFYVQVVSHYRVGYIPNNLMCYRVHANNLTKTKWIVRYHFYKTIQFYLDTNFWNKKKVLQHLFSLDTSLFNATVIFWRIKILLQLFLPPYIKDKIFNIKF